MSNRQSRTVAPRGCRCAAPWLMSLVLLALPAAAQVRGGAALLRLPPGARHESMASAFTGAVDELPAIFLNPAALGYARQWQWSATYNKWIADVYQASFIAGQRLSFLGSRHTSMALGFTYLGMPDFDSTDGKVPAAAANDIVASLAVSERIGGGPVAIGANVKYLRSRLDRYQEQTLATDFGILLRPLRFSFLPAGRGFLDYGYFSAGFSLLNVGRGLKFIQTGTPLPRMWRAGAAFHAGTHHGLQLLLAADVSQVKSENAAAALGAEMWWSALAGVRLGYVFDDSRLGKFTFGAGLQLGGMLTSAGMLSRRDDNATRFDLAASSQDELFGVTYRGSLSHYPELPESFDFVSPADAAFFYENTVSLRWQPSQDPDPFDLTHYLLLVDEDSLKLRQALNAVRSDFRQFLEQAGSEEFLVLATIDSNRYQLGGLIGGDYFWTVIAFDLDDHIRLAGAGREYVRKFTVADQNLMITGREITPAEWISMNADVAIKAIDFQPSPWITTTPEQGRVLVTIENQGRLPLAALRVAVYDRFVAPPDTVLPLIAEKNGADLMRGEADRPIGDQLIASLAPQQIHMLEFEWHTELAGRHLIIAVADEEQLVPESDEENNRLAASYATIPKGTVSCPASTVALNVHDISSELPFIAAVYFAGGDTIANEPYLAKWPLERPLKTFGKRLRNNPSLHVRLRGFADPLAGESSIELANQRSAAVRHALNGFGAQAGQIKIDPGVLLPSRRLPADTVDAQMVLQERRRVDIVVDDAVKPVLFRPLSLSKTDSIYTPVPFMINIEASEPLTSSQLSIRQSRLRQPGEAADSALIPVVLFPSQRQLQGTLSWDLAKSTSARAGWIGRSFAYQIQVQDAEGRSFRTPEQTSRLDSAVVHVRHEIYGPAKFGKAEPLYDFYWTHLLSNISRMLGDPSLRVRFVGHACSIGPLSVNQRLSQLRAATFRDRFLQEIRQRLPQHYVDLQNRVDLAVGMGERQPLRVDLDGAKSVLVGDNSTPLGRVLNRRIEITFYTAQVFRPGPRGE